MIISNILGGIGNQMFQYAAGRALSVKTNQKLLLDLRDFSNYYLHQGYELSRVFNVPTDNADQTTLNDVLGWRSSQLARRVLRRPQFEWLRGKQFVQEPCSSFWPDFFKLNGDCYLSGYWQSEHYFKSIESLIRKDFSFREDLLSERNYDMAAEIVKSQSVSLHIRRGDYISNTKNREIMSECSSGYYQNAINHIVEKIECPIFYVFSDEMSWVKQNLCITFPCVYVEHNQGHESFQDMWLMSLCKHHIIANSSFSWWGAWLNPKSEKLVVAPKTWFNNSYFNDRDLIPNRWIRL